MDSERLRELGLTVRSTEGGLEADLEFTTNSLVNPLTRSFIQKVTFTILGDRLIALEPAELVGIAPISTSGLERMSALEEQVVSAFNDHILHLQRRSAELQTLGLSPLVDPAQLSLSAEVVSSEGLKFLIGADKRGNFRVLSAQKDGAPLDVSAGHTFELSEFRELNALAGYLTALFHEPTADTPTPPSYQQKIATPEAPQRITYGEVMERFTVSSVVPPRSSLEILVELSVAGEVYRFAAARVAGRTFRGLLAGAKGKLWAERFELEDFPGVVPLVADLLRVPQEEVRVLDESGS